jgi:predicted GIY-YIG superfamily endonuclease
MKVEVGKSYLLSMRMKNNLRMTNHPRRRKKDPFRAKTFLDLEYTAARSEEGSAVKKESKIKNEPVEEHKKIAPARNNEIDDDE